MSKQAIIEKIEAYDTIIIHRHVRPDPDALGSQVGLRDMLRASYPEKDVYAVGEEEPTLNFLARMDEVADDLYKDALVIVCDTANTARIDDQRYTSGKEIIKIDHHPNHDKYAALLWVDTEASSTSEMIFELYLSGKDQSLQMNATVARLLYGGIVGDTGRFMFPNTRNQTFRYAAELIEYEFDRSALYDGLYNVGQAISHLRGYVLQNFTVSASGVSTVKITQEILDAHKVTAAETGSLVGTLGDVEGIRAWAFFIEEADIIRVRIRSKGIVINELAGKFNGGGHPLASGAAVYSWEEADQFTAELESLVASQI